MQVVIAFKTFITFYTSDSIKVTIYATKITLVTVFCPSRSILYMYRSVKKVKNQQFPLRFFKIMKKKKISQHDLTINILFRLKLTFCAEN